MSDGEIVALLRAELSLLAKSVQELTIGLALVDQRLQLTKELQDSIKTLHVTITGLDRRLIRISGLNGDNGQISEIATKVGEHGKKLDGLMLSRAAIAGYMTASAGLATAAVKFLF